MGREVAPHFFPIEVEFEVWILEVEVEVSRVTFPPIQVELRQMTVGRARQVEWECE